MRAAIVWLGVLGLAGCSSVLGTGDQEWGERAEQSGIQLSISASPATLSSGQETTLVARVVNKNAHAVRLVFPSTCEVTVYVESPGGDVVFPEGGNWFCGAAMTEVALGAGEAKEYHRPWQTPADTPAGSYRAYAKLDGTANGERMKLTSPEVTVRIR